VGVKATDFNVVADPVTDILPVIVLVAGYALW